MKQAMISFKTRCASLLVCLVMGIGYVVPAQSQALGSLFNLSRSAPSGHANEWRLNSNMELEEALKLLEARFGVVFLYETEAVRNQMVSEGYRVPNNIEQALELLLSERALEYKYLNPKTYGIYKVREEILELPLAEEAEFQQRIQGRVVDSESGEALPGVNILVEGTMTGTATDADGSFELSVPSLDVTLVFTYIGYQQLSMPLEGRTLVNVTLAPMAIAGDEVVVTALGIRRDTRSLGYSTATVSPAEMTVNRTTNFIQSLQGKVPGLNVAAMSTGSGGSTGLNIRGISAFSGANSPLIVVDGIPISNDRHFGGTQGPFDAADSGDGLLSISPDVIESMTVLKGATAAALYGSRAKDGVIMITTKDNAGSRRIGVTFTSNFTIERVIDETDFQYEYGQGEQGVRPTSPFPMSGVWSFGEKIEPGMTQILFDGIEVPYEAQRNQLKEFYDGGYTANNTLTLASGTQNSGFSLTLSSLNNDGITPNSGFDRYNVSVGFTQDVVAGLNVSGNLNYSQEVHTNPPILNGQEITTPKTIYTMANTMPLYLLRENQRLPDGREMPWARFEVRTNPYLSVNDYFNDVQRDRVFGNLSMRYNVLEWLYVQGRIGQDYYARSQDLNVPSLLGGKPPAPPGFINGSVTNDRRNFREINADFLVGATREITSSLGVDVTLGGNRMYQHSERNSVFGEDFIVPWLYTIGNTRVQTPLYTYTERAVNSLYGSVDFNFRDYLYLSVTARNDWFSTLSPEERSILYPSVSASFVFTDFFDGLPSWLNFGTLRVAYAEVGSDTDISPFSGVLNYQINSKMFQGPLSVQPMANINTNTIPNPHLRPMRLKEREVGLNVMMFDRVNMELVYYSKLSIDQILNAAVSNTSSYSSTRVNVGESRTSGFEAFIDLMAVQGTNFRWNFGLNGTYITSKVLKLGESDEDVSIGGSVRHIVGQPMAQMYRSGYLRDEQGRKIFNPNNGLPLATPQAIYLGETLPKWIGGFTNTFNYRGLEFYALIDFKLGHKVYQNNNFDNVRHGKHKKTLVGRDVGYVIGDGVLPDGSPNTIQVPIQPYYEADAQIQEGHVANGGFWKLRQVSLGYDFTSLVSAYLPVQGLSFNVIVNNVYTFKKWTENMDPEQMSSPNSDTISYALPLSRSFGFNLKVEI